MDSPSPNGDNGRNGQGRFTTGNRYGKGNPHGRKAAALRRAMMGAVTAGDIRAVVRALVDKAKNGEPWAIRELLDRTVGRDPPIIEVGGTGSEVETLTLTDILDAAGRDRIAADPARFGRLEDWMPPV